MPAPIKAAVAKKASVAKKAAPAKAAAPKQTTTKVDNEVIMNKIVALREKDPPTPWGDISSTLGVGQGKAMLLYMYAKVAPKDRIKITGDPATDNAKIVAGREAGLSWGQLMARTQLGEGKLRAMFEEASGTTALGHRIGKGGRYAAGEGPAPANGTAKKVAGTKKAAPVKAAAAKKSAAPVSNKIFADMTLHELQDRLDGKKITFQNAQGKNERHTVKKVTSTKDGEIRFTDDKGAVHKILAVQIKAASR